MDGMCSPMSSSQDEKNKKYYPSFTYSGDEKMPLPEGGDMTIEYRKIRSSESTNSDGKKRYECTIEIRRIESVEENENASPPASNKSKDTEDALDALVAARIKSKSKDKTSEY